MAQRDRPTTRSTSALRALRVLACLALGTLIAAGCASLPDHVQRTESKALVQTEDSRLGQALRTRLAAHPGTSGFLPLVAAQEAFAARMLLAQAAQKSLDVQYYIWHGDTTGHLLWEALWQAAERGVRVRLLLDDNNTAGLDVPLAALDSHPHIEIRLFNPFANRGFRLGDFAFDFSRVNRRMHNKSFTADNQVSIVGGRNVGDEYYGANLELGFQDLDILAVGPVVREVSDDFDRYWNDPAAYPAATVLAPAAPGSMALLRQRWQASRQDPDTLGYLQSVDQTPLVKDVTEDRVAFEWAPARVVSDPPSKIRQSPQRRDLQMFSHLEQALGSPRRELDLVSPYFVPGDGGTKILTSFAEQGVKVRILTNSLAATDVAAVHAGYAKYRKKLLQAGVILYELKPGPIVSPLEEQARRKQLGGSSTASLHAKTFSVDRDRIFVGSLNLDPRSVTLNTEMGVVIESATLANRLSTELDTVIPNAAYELRLRADAHSLEWIERAPQGELRHETEPGGGPLLRLWVRLLSILPIEWLL